MFRIDFSCIFTELKSIKCVNDKEEFLQINQLYDFTWLSWLLSNLTVFVDGKIEVEVEMGASDWPDKWGVCDMMLCMPQDAGVLELRTVERYKEGVGNMAVEAGAGLRIGVEHCSKGAR